MMAEKDPSKLIDLELVNLLKFCNDLKVKHRETDDYQEALMMNAVEIGKKHKDKTLILDMDETMIAAKFDGKEGANFKPHFTFPFGDTKIHVKFRPYLTETLEKLSQLYEIVVWTAGVQDYADPILDEIDRERTLFKKRMYRPQCIKADQFFIKDLDVILDRTRENLVIVDNSILSFAFDLANGVPINSFMGTEDDDKDLIYLVSFLEEAFYQDDVRVACEESFKLQYLLSTITGQELQR
jgi:Dullard-like phosphatase family protein